MSLWDRFKRAFGAGGDPGLYYYVQCDRCGDIVRVRLNPTTELQQEYESGQDAVTGYSVRKVLIDQRCHRPIELSLRFDARRREQSRSLEGGTFVTAEAYEASRT